MNVFRRFAMSSVALATCALVAACESEPSEAEMTAAINQTYASINSDVGGIGNFIKKDLSTKVKSLKKFGCAQAKGKPGFLCDFEVTISSPIRDETKKETARFVKSDKGWSMMEK